MAPPGGRTSDDLSRGKPDPASVEARLAGDPHSFGFFQAVRLLQLLRPEAAEVGHVGPVDAEPVRFAGLASTAFPASEIAALRSDGSRAPTMTVAFLGMFGPKGVLPQHYTEEVMRLALENDERKPEKRAMQAWLDLFNHRLVGLFYRTWEKYRLAIPYERATRRGDSTGSDAFTNGLIGLVGLGTRGLRDRLGPPADEEEEEEAPGRVDDEALLHFAGLLSRRTSTASGLEALLSEYFDLPVAVRQFQGQWLTLEAGQQSRLGGPGSRSGLGRDAVAGSRIWDVRSKVRIRVGPVGYAGFRSFLPDPERPGALAALSRLVRFYLGPELDFDVQLILRRDAVPPCRLGGEGASVLGWNSWIGAGGLDSDPEDAIFPEVEPHLPGPSARLA